MRRFAQRAGARVTFGGHFLWKDVRLRMGTVLVVGGAGYIGSHVCKLLKAVGVVPVTFVERKIFVASQTARGGNSERAAASST